MLQGHKTTPRCPGGSRELVPHRGQAKVTGVPVQAWHAPQYPWRSSSGWWEVRPHRGHVKATAPA
jgi:hypothetical protein